jgi:isopentenyl diphosphate isomerase/L-lactate dehydrogenase-like FMN-dependent dehydrogenase
MEMQEAQLEKALEQKDLKIHKEADGKDDKFKTKVLELEWRLRAPSTIEALPAIVDAVGPRIEVWFDSGIRSGQDVLRALALGAKATMIGRAYLHGLGAMGEAGVTRCLEIIRKELDITMAFCGRTDVRQVDRSILLPRHP